MREGALRVCEATLRQWRAEARGPAFIKIESKVSYPKARLAEYLQAHTELYVEA